MAAKIEELTEEQIALQTEVRDWWAEFCTTPGLDTDYAVIKEEIKWLYEINGYNTDPMVIVVDSPVAAIFLARKMEPELDIKSTDYIGLGYDSCWVAFYEYFEKIGAFKLQLDTNEEREKQRVAYEKLLHMRRMLKAGAWDMLLFDELAIIVRPPVVIRRDEQLRLHAEDGPALKFRDGETCAIYAWHGVLVPPRLINDPDSYTREEIMSEENSENRRILAEKLGWEKYTDKVGVVEVDKWQDPETGLEYTLLDFKERDGELQPRLLKMQSPEVKDGTKPFYIEAVDPRCRTAQAARKSQFPKLDGTMPTIDECNKSPEMKFQIET